MIENELQIGIQAVKNGEFEKARIYLSQVVRNNPYSEDGWLWFGHSLVDTEKRIFCYRKVLSINSQNDDARQKLDELTGLSIPNRPRTDDISEEGKSTDRPDNLNNGGKKKQDSSGDQKKRILMIAGFLVGIILIGLPLMFFIMTGKFDALLVTAPTSKPTLVSSPTDTFLPTTSQTPSLTSSPTITELSSTTFTVTPIPGSSVGSYILEAKNQITNKEYADAILKLNQAIEKYPREAELYYLRATCYYGLLSNQRSESEYSDYLSSAFSDMDEAIAIRADIGDYYALRQSLIVDLMGIYPYQVDQHWLSDLAAQNELMALALGSTIHDYPDRIYILDLIYAYKCDEGLQKVNALIGTINATDTSINGLYMIQSIAYACLGQNDKALNSINNALVKNPDNTIRRELKAKYLYLVGKKSESLTLLNELIEKAPAYNGDRYYLRALIYYELGMRDKAEEDLLSGAGNTWASLIFPTHPIPYSSSRSASLWRWKQIGTYFILKHHLIVGG
jgi:tetratricopeptide (TPR) repeat protein